MILLEPVAVADQPGVSDDGLVCIFCACRPDVSYCGAYDDGPGEDLVLNEQTCRACAATWATTGCPGCGCVRDDACDLCDPPQSFWWRWW